MSAVSVPRFERRAARVRRALLLVAAIALLLSSAPDASAHNSFVRSKPADGAELDALPKRVTLVFAKAVPLDTIQVVLIQASGARRDASGFRHGAGGAQEVIVPLRAIEPGPLTMRWRLVNSDGHVVSGRVRLAVSAPPSSTAESTEAEALPGSAGITPETPLPTPADPVFVEETADGAWTTPDALQWLIRAVSFLAMVVVAGAIVTAWQVWPGAARQPRLRLYAAVAALVVGIAAGAQLVLLAAELTGKQPLDAWDGLDPVLSLDAGRAYAARAALALVLFLLLIVPGGRRARWQLAALLSVGAFATWAFAGHASSQRWPWIGVPVDVAHHAAAAAWLGALGMLAFVVFRAAPLDDLVDAVQRFSLIAATAVAAVVATGVIQSLRLVGGPSALIETTHGRVLIAKVALLGVMLYVADLNRRRVRSRFRRPETVTRPARRVLQRAMLTEAAIGAAVLAVTAALVVQTPGASDDGGAAVGSSASADAAAPDALVGAAFVTGENVLRPGVVPTPFGGLSCTACDSSSSPRSSPSRSPRVAEATMTSTPRTTRADR